MKYIFIALRVISFPFLWVWIQFKRERAKDKIQELTTEHPEHIQEKMNVYVTGLRAKGWTNRRIKRHFKKDYNVDLEF